MSRAFFKVFCTGGGKRLKGQGVRVTGGIAFGGDSDFRPQVDRQTGYTNRGRSQYNIGLHFVLFVVPGILDDL